MPGKREELEALARRCETEGPSLPLNYLIFLAANPDWVDTRKLSKFGRPKGQMIASRDEPRAALRVEAMPDFSKSIDAAVTLIPPGHSFSLTDWSEDTNLARARVFTADFDFKWDRAKTPALAICAASLRALASMEADNA